MTGIIPVAAEAGVERGGPIHHGGKYPWRTMAVGDSFAVTKKSEGSAGSMAAMASVRNAPKKFSHGRDKAGAMRVWRDA